MPPTRNDLATKGYLSEMQNLLRGEISGVREELKTEISGVREEILDLRVEMATLRTEMEHRYATRADVQAMSERFIAVMADHVRTVIVVQAATMVGMSGILFGLLRFA